MVTTSYAGQTIDVGTVTATNDTQNLYVTYNLKEGWYLTETHVWAGSIDQLPVNNSDNPVIGSFTYHGYHDSTISTYKYTIPLCSLPASGEYYISAHGVVVKKVNGAVVQKETMFGYGIDYAGKRWGWYFPYCNTGCSGTIAGL